MYFRIYTRLYTYHKLIFRRYRYEESTSESAAEIMLSLLVLIWAFLLFLLFRLFLPNENDLFNVPPILSIFIASLILGFNWFMFGYQSKGKKKIKRYKVNGDLYHRGLDFVADMLIALSWIFLFVVAVLYDSN